jgi:hypothetical protein
MKNKVLKNPIAPKGKEDGVYPWSFTAPSYDNRTSCSIPAGNEYKTGFRNPVGKEKAGSMESGPIPLSSHAFSPHEVFDGEDEAG